MRFIKIYIITNLNNLTDNTEHGNIYNYPVKILNLKIFICIKKGDFMKVIIFSLLITLPFSFLYGETRGLKDVEKKLNQRIILGFQYLLLIASDTYDHWPNLKNPVSDAKEIKEIITSRYYIDKVIELYNKEATKANILRTFGDLQKRLKINDSLLIFYAGHGYYDKEVTKTGFWIPTNGGLDSHEQSNWIPNPQIRGMISNFKASHILLISDSCFSGDILHTMRGPDPIALESTLDTIKDKQVIKTYNLTSRQVITSGASEFVPDNSEFSLQLRMTLEKNSNPYLDPFTLYSHIKKGVNSTIPLLGCLNNTGHQEGASFYLFLKDIPDEDKKDRDKEDKITVPGEKEDMVSPDPDIPFYQDEEESRKTRVKFIPERLSLHLFAAYTAPVINEISESLSPSFFLDLIASYSIYELNIISLSVLLGSLFTYHIKAPDITYKNNLLVTALTAGISVGCTFPFYKKMSMHLNILTGYGISYVESGNYNEPATSFGDPIVLGQLEAKHSITKHLMLSVKGSYLIVPYIGENKMWLHELSGGIGIGYSF